MSALVFLPPGADGELIDTLLTGLRNDPDVRSAFGTPPRVFDGETERELFPFASLERVESEDASFIGAEARLHRMTFVTASRDGGRRRAVELVDTLASATQRVSMTLNGQNIVYRYVVYTDVVRPPDRRHFRGLMRLKILCRAVVSPGGGAA